MTPKPATDIDTALDYFHRTHQHVIAVTTGLSDAQWRFKPAPDCWSIAEILEHMVLIEERVLGPIRTQLEQSPAPSADYDPAVVDRIVFEKLPDRSVKAKAPAGVNPSGEWTRADTLDRIARNYQRLAEFVQSTPGLRQHTLESPPLRFITNGAHTTMDGLQWAITAAAHDERHLRQIEELQALANYPPPETTPY